GGGAGAAERARLGRRATGGTRRSAGNAPRAHAAEPLVARAARAALLAQSSAPREGRPALALGAPQVGAAASAFAGGPVPVAARDGRIEAGHEERPLGLGGAHLAAEV